MPQMKVDAPAKLNLHLQLGEKRPDGYHDIESLFLALAFGDTLYFEPGPSPLTLIMDWQTEAHSELSPEKNIISRAVSLFRDRTGFDEGLKITVQKRIPLGGGLGGGSSDAAATLLGLNRLFTSSQPGNSPLNLSELLEIGADLGSDVPFFLYNTPAAWINGRGELVQPLDLPENARNLSFVLVNPGFPSDTARAFQLLDRMRERRTRSIDSISSSSSKLSAGQPSSVVKILLDPPRDWQFFNDFLPVFRDGDKDDTALSEAGGVYQRIIDDLQEQEADFAGLSGSGSTCFGVFSRHNGAESARDTLLKRFPFVILTFSLAR